MKKLYSILFLTVLSTAAFAYTAEIDGIYYNFDNTNKTAVVTSGDNKYTGSVVIPETVTFDGVTYTVNIIGSRAFKGCWDMTSVTIPKTIVRLDDEAFYLCYGLKEVHITDLSAWMNIDYWGGNIERRLPTEYSHCLYLNGELLKNVTIPEDITKISRYPFYSCDCIESLSIHSGVTKISASAFAHCSNLATINVDENNTVFDSRNGCNAIIETANNKIVLGGTATVIPNGITGIDRDAFYGRSGLTSITFPNSVTWIGEYAFEDCIGLTTITLPNSINSIGQYAFLNCDNLTEVRIGNRYTSIGVGSFTSCDHLLDFYCSTYDPPVSDGDIFYGCWNLTIHVPIGCKEVYDTATGWSGNNIVEDNLETVIFPFPDCPQGETRQAALYLNKKGIIEGEEGLLLPNREASRAEIAKISLYGLADGPSNIDYLETDDYPSVYTDLQDKDTYYYRSAKKLLYLDYGDGVTPFDHNRLAFEPQGKIARDHVLKVMLETFNIQPDLEGTDNPFPNDVNVAQVATTQPRLMGYIREAAELGIISTDKEEFRPYAYCTRGEAFVLLARIMKKIDNWEIDRPDWKEESNTFLPLNITLKTIALGVGLELGNFRHYTKTSFDMDGVMPLTFSHSYNSYNTTLPSVFFGVKDADNSDDTYQPLGDGWSHTYHSFVTIVGNLADESARAIVHWGGGGIDVYKSDNSRIIPESLGIFDEFELDGNEVVVTTKEQIKYRFAALTGSSAKIMYLKSITDRNDNALTINYEDGVNEGKRISSISDGYRSLTFLYLEGTNLLSEVKDPLNRSISFSYFDNPQTLKKQLQSFTDAEGNTTTYEYADLTTVGASKLLSRIQLPKGNYIENEYDANRKLTKTVSGLDGIPTKETNVTVGLDYYDNYVSTSSEVNIMRNGQSLTYEYQFDDSNLVYEVQGPEYCTWYNYSDEIHPELPTEIYIGTYGYIYYQYDSKGNVTECFKNDNPFSPDYLSMTYDGMNNLTSITDRDGNTTTYNYDTKGNLIEILAPEDVTMSIKVNAMGLPEEVEDAMGIKTKLEYNSHGNLTKTTLPALGLVSEATYDEASRLTSTKDALNRVTLYQYNNNDDLIVKTDADSHVTRYGYDANGNLTDVTNAKNGVTSLSYDNTTDWLTSMSFGGATKQFAYNDDGTLSTITKPDGNQLSFNFDGSGRITSDGIRTYSYDDIRLSEISENGKSVSIKYSDDRIQEINNEGNIINYGFDSNGNCTRVNNISYNYDGLNRLTDIYLGGNLLVDYSYRDDSQLSEIYYYKDYALIMRTEFKYDEIGRMTGKKTILSDNENTVISNYEFVLDAYGNIIEQTSLEPFAGVSLSSRTINYTYDDANHITKAGNIDFTFDKNGNMTKRGIEDYTWNLSDQLTNAGGTEITYNPLGFISSYGDITYTTDPVNAGNVLSDSKSGAQYIYGDGLEARIVNDVISFYVTDSRGSVVAIVDENCNVTHKYQYDEFGNVLQKVEADYNPFKYVGRYGVMYLNDHLYYMRARHYDPTIGRFISEDPIWSTNLYPYTENNPIMGIDPLGLKNKKTYCQKQYDKLIKKANEAIDLQEEGKQYKKNKDGSIKVDDNGESKETKAYKKRVNAMNKAIDNLEEYCIHQNKNGGHVGIYKDYNGVHFTSSELNVLRQGGTYPITSNGLRTEDP